jgi:hypothetical protein
VGGVKIYTGHGCLHKDQIWDIFPFQLPPTFNLLIACVCLFLTCFISIISHTFISLVTHSFHIYCSSHCSYLLFLTLFKSIIPHTFNIYYYSHFSYILLLTLFKSIIPHTFNIYYYSHFS